MKMAVGCLLFKGAVSRILSKFKQEPPPNVLCVANKIQILNFSKNETNWYTQVTKQIQKETRMERLKED